MEPQFIKCGANIKLKRLSFGPKKKIFSLLNIITLKLWFYHNYHKKSGMRSPGSMHDTGCLGLVYWAPSPPAFNPSQHQGLFQ